MESAAGRVWRVVVTGWIQGGYAASAVRRAWLGTGRGQGLRDVTIMSSPMALAFADWLARRINLELGRLPLWPDPPARSRATWFFGSRGSSRPSARSPHRRVEGVALLAAREAEALGAGPVKIYRAPGVDEGRSAGRSEGEGEGRGIGADAPDATPVADSDESWAATIVDDVGREVLAVLSGRLLTGYEVHRLLRASTGSAVTPDVLGACLEVLTLRGSCRLRPGVALDGLGFFRCTRCGSVEGVRASECLACLGTGPGPLRPVDRVAEGRRGQRRGGPEAPHVCVACLECQALGVLTSCTPVYTCSRRPGGEPATEASDDAVMPMPGRKAHFSIRLPFELTKAQTAAALQVEEFVRSGRDTRRECLLLAACGAGKTEACFASIQAVVSGGGRVLIAMPRKDPATQLALRLAQAFAGCEVTCLVGSSGAGDGAQPPRLGALADIVVATTHQCLRLREAFDLVILDEVDAFPYSGSRMLYHAVHHAATASAKVVYVTATPERWLLDAARSGRCALATIPARYHGYPLPVPSVVRCTDDQTEPVAAQVAWLTGSSLEAGARVLVFAPTVELVERLGAALARSRPPCVGSGRQGQAHGVTYVHSRDPGRDEKVQAFCSGRIPVLVSTTLLERSLTIDNVHVVVAMAHHERVFCDRTLVQVSGRVGRTSSHPSGQVWFVAPGVSPSMRRAIHFINELNRAARDAGFLTSGDAGMPSDGPDPAAPDPARRPAPR